MKKISRLSIVNKNETAFSQLGFKPASHTTIDRHPGMLAGQDLKELSQPNIHKPLVVSLKKTDKRPIPQTLEGQADGSIQRICAWCNTVMREGTKPATHGMCPKCLEEQRQSLEARKSHSGS